MENIENDVRRAELRAFLLPFFGTYASLDKFEALVAMLIYKGVNAQIAEMIAKGELVMTTRFKSGKLQ